MTTETLRYEGERLFSDPKVYCVDAEGTRTPLPHHVRYHSTNGFAWGDAGQASLELALNIIVDALGPEASVCTRCHGRRRYRGAICSECIGLGIARVIWGAHRDFAHRYIAGLPERRWSLARQDILDWYRSIGLQEAIV